MIAEVREVDLDLIDGASLALAPGCNFGAAKIFPVLFGGKLSTGCGTRRVGARLLTCSIVSTMCSLLSGATTVTSMPVSNKWAATPAPRLLDDSRSRATSLVLRWT